VNAAFALMVQTADQPAGTGEIKTDFFKLLGEGGAIAQIVLVILLIFSAISWAVIFYKYWQFSRVARQTRTFLDVFRKSSKFSEVQAVCRTLTESPLTGLFQAGYGELNTQLRGTAPENRPQQPAPRPTLKSLDAVERARLRAPPHEVKAVERGGLRATTVELNRLERRVPFLATTASITPFIGLFGTVWGIMDSFQRIGVAGSSSLGVVAPGIAHALIATAAGLFAAIPAVYFYNHFTNRVKHFSGEMDDFSLEFLNIAERNFT
jgi:biopolymer transport protein TolQ